MHDSVKQLDFQVASNSLCKKSKDSPVQILYFDDRIECSISLPTFTKQTIARVRLSAWVKGSDRSAKEPELEKAGSNLAGILKTCRIEIKPG